MWLKSQYWQPNQRHFGSKTRYTQSGQKAAFGIGQRRNTLKSRYLTAAFFMNDLIGELLHVRVLANDLYEAPYIVPALSSSIKFLFKSSYLLHQGSLLVIIARYHEGKLLVAETTQGVILIELAE